ncbi:MAG TPA: FAD-binding oxidoreductase [Bauldia sp.]|nr:FAD-binding oxidoreductase [Bauldia sp.]
MPHAPSLYAATADASLTFAPLAESTRADVVIVGGGYTGLSAALHLAEAGVDVVVLEAERVGWGASGRNGGQLHSGQRRDQDWLEEHVGLDEAIRLWRLAEEAKALVHSLIAKHRIDAEWRPGLIETTHKARLVDGERAHVEKLRTRYGYEAVTWLDRAELAEAIGTDVYFGGRRDTGAGHLHPLKFAQGLARAAAQAGARIYEGARVVRVVGTGVEVEVPSPRASGSLSLSRGAALSPSGRGDDVRGALRVQADTVILAGNGYLAGIDAEVEARVMPIDNYILATAPIGAGMSGGIIPGGEAVSDTRFVVYYYRPTSDGRLVFGGGETYARHYGGDVAELVRKHLRVVYPQFGAVKVDYAWGGTLAVTIHRLPYIRKVRSGVYAAAGYSGQGVALAPFAGKVIADAVRNAPGKLDAFAALSTPRFPGGKLLRKPALVAGMLWYALRDRI